MQLLSSIVVACAALGFGRTASGYLIDPDSCTGNNYQFVNETVEQAFTMAHLMSASVKTTPFDPNAVWLLKQLFNFSFGEKGDSGFSGAAKTQVEKAIDVKWNGARDMGILAFEKEQTGSLDALVENEVVIFCNTDRLVRRAKDPLHLYDTKVKQAVVKSRGCANAFMYTQRFDNHWDTITICPWFLQYAVSKKYHTKKSFSGVRTWLAVKGLDELITKLFYTPIDLLSLWDKSMLHEMMHTKAAGLKDDVGGLGGYGWKNCRKLSTKTNAVDNADSWAIFGSALYWAGLGSPIDADGNFTSPPIAAQGGSKRWFGSGVGRGLEAVKLDAVKQFI